MPKLTFSAKAHSENQTKTIIESRNFKMIVDEPANLGGTDEGANPVEYLLAALAGCLNVVGHVVANELKMNLNGIEITLEGDLNPAKFMGQSDAERAGYQELRVSIKPDTDADQATLAKWLTAIESRCPVSDNIGNVTPVKINLA